MLKYENIIKNLTVDEKLGLITSCKFVETRKIANYEFPLLKVTNLDEIDFSFNKVGATFNVDLIRKSGIHNGALKLNENDKTVLALPVTTEGKCFSKDPYLAGIFTSYFARGVEEAGSLTAYKLLPRLNSTNVFNYANYELKTFNVAINNYEPFMIEADTSDSLSLVDKFGYDGFKVVLAKSELDLINAIKNKANLSIIDGQDPLEPIKEAIRNYNRLYRDYTNNRITLTDFYTEINSSNALNPKDIDILVDKILTALNIYDSQKRTSVFEEDVEEEIAKQSIILLKNDKNYLPIDRNTKVSFIGEDLIRIAEKNDIKLSELIDQFGLVVKGIAHGYVNDMPLDLELVEKSVDLINNSDYSFVFIDSLSDEKVKFIQEIKKIENKKIIYVLLFRDNEDLSLFSDCETLILSFDKRIYTIKALLALFVGEFFPSGKLPFEVKSEDGNILFPLARGLSFADIQYSNFLINDLGAHLTVTNKSNFTAYDTVLLFIQYLDEEGFKRELKGFKKVLLNKGESQIIEFPFDFDTFKVYDVDNKYNKVLPGSYKITMAKDYETPIIEGVVDIEGEDDDLRFKSDKIDDNQINIVKAPAKPLFSTKAKFSLLTILSIYYYTLIILTMVFVKNEPTLITCIVLLSLYSVFLITFIIKNIIYANRRKRIKESDESLEDAISNMKSFDEVYHSKYEEPKPAEPEIEDIQILEEEEYEPEIAAEEEEEEPEVKKIFTYDSFGNQVDDYNEYQNQMEFDEIVKSFVNYALYNGVIIESIDARNLIASIYSNNLILINNKSKEYNEKLFEILNQFLGNDTNCLFDVENIEDPIHLYWDENEDSYQISEFTDKLSSSNGYTSRLNLFVFNNVTKDKIDNLLNPFVEFAEAPLMEHKINIGEDYNIQIPKNCVFVFLIDDPLFIENIDYRLASTGLYIELLTRSNEIEAEEEKLSLNSYQYIEFLIRNNREKHYLNEEIWKKIDDLCENKAFSEFKLDNKSVTTVEKLISLIMANGNDINEALNQAFKERIVPIFKTLEEYKKENGDKILIDVIEKIFEDQLEESIKLLKKKE